MHDRQRHRGFLITISARDESAGGSSVTVLVERERARGTDMPDGELAPEPEHYRYLHTGLVAINEAMQRAKGAIDVALGERDRREGE